MFFVVEDFNFLSKYSRSLKCPLQCPHIASYALRIGVSVIELYGFKLAIHFKARRTGNFAMYMH